MTICLYDDVTNGKVKRYCRMSGHDLVMIPSSSKLVDERTSADWLHNSDVIILEISQPTPAIHFVIAQAILLSKPTLCLYKKNHPPRQLLQFIRRQRYPRAVRSLSYSLNNLDGSIKQFLQLHHTFGTQHDVIPSIKFTLRITPMMDAYLEWITGKQDIPKADYLRELLEVEMMSNTAYQRHVVGNDNGKNVGD